jgi:hypothetical protein
VFTFPQMQSPGLRGRDSEWAFLEKQYQNSLITCSDVRDAHIIAVLVYRASNSFGAPQAAFSRSTGKRNPTAQKQSLRKAKQERKSSYDFVHPNGRRMEAGH